MVPFALNVSHPSPNAFACGGLQVDTKGAGGIFGDLALLYNAPRNATVLLWNARLDFWWVSGPDAGDAP